jgi:hypothetical protein
MNSASSHTINSNNCTIPIDIKLNSANFIPKISKNATTKVSAHLLILKMKSSKTLSSSTCSKRPQIFIFTSTKLSGVHLLKSIFLYKVAIKEISVYMPTTFRILGEILKSMHMSQKNVSFGTFLMKLSQLKRQDVSWVWTAKDVMAGWSKDTIHQSIQLRKINH